MPIACRQLVARRPRHGLALAICLLSGCAVPNGPSWANFKDAKSIDVAAADDDFPSATEVGLASTDRTAKAR